MLRLWLIFSQAATIAVALLFVVSTFRPEWLPARPAAQLPMVQNAAPSAQPAVRANSYSEAVQRAAMKTWKGERTFAENAKAEPEIAAQVSAAEIDRLCSTDIHFRHVDATFKALGLE